IEAIIQSMTRFEKKDPYALIREPNRTKRIAKGSGSTEQAVNELIQKFLFMRQMMGNLGGGGGGGLAGLLGQIPGMGKLKMAKNLQKQMAMGGGFPGMPAGFPGMGGFPGMPGMGAPEDSLTKMKPLSTAQKNAKKASRKREKDARRKSRK
ncbi:MAG: signal recognition particle protein, partial [Polyangiaceae bacterium]